MAISQSASCWRPTILSSLCCQALFLAANLLPSATWPISANRQVLLAASLNFPIILQYISPPCSIVFGAKCHKYETVKVMKMSPLYKWQTSYICYHSANWHNINTVCDVKLLIVPGIKCILRKYYVGTMHKLLWSFNSNSPCLIINNSNIPFLCQKLKLQWLTTAGPTTKSDIFVTRQQFKARKDFF